MRFTDVSLPTVEPMRGSPKTTSAAPDAAYRRFVDRSEIYQPAPLVPPRVVGAQSRLESAIETAINIASGFVVANCVYLFVVGPVFALPLDLAMSMQINAIFIAASVVRSYFWRRFFNNRVHKRIHKWLVS